MNNGWCISQASLKPGFLLVPQDIQHMTHCNKDNDLQDYSEATVKAKKRECDLNAKGLAIKGKGRSLVDLLLMSEVQKQQSCQGRIKIRMIMQAPIVAREFKVALNDIHGCPIFNVAVIHIDR